MAIIGAGPAGNQTAYRLARLGYHVTVLEEHDVVGHPVHCTGVVSTECVERYEIPREFILTELSSSRVFGPSGGMLTLGGNGVQAYVVDRGAFDRGLAEEAQRRGAEYFLGTAVQDVKVFDHRVRLSLLVGADNHHLDAKAAVIATGFRSGLTQRLGLGRTRRVIFGGQALVDAPKLTTVEIYTGRNVAPGSFAWAVPWPQGRALVGLVCQRRVRYYLDRLLATLLSEGKIGGVIRMLRFRGIPISPLPKTFKRRILVVGDAAGQVKPTTGGGIYYSLICADLAADVLHQGLARDDLSEGLLANYERLWRLKLGQELRRGYLIRKVCEQFPDDLVEQIIRTTESSSIKRLLLSKAPNSFDWHSESLLALLKDEMIRLLRRRM